MQEKEMCLQKISKKILYFLLLFLFIVFLIPNQVKGSQNILSSQISNYFLKINNFTSKFIQSDSDGIQEGISKVITEDMTSVYLTIYLAGVTFFSLRFFYGIGRLMYLYFRSEKTKQWGFHVVHVTETITLFTFFNVLFIPQETVKDEALESLIVHEQYHRDQLHSIDTILLEILAILFWFNPMMWLFKRDIKTVHEYLADAKVLSSGFDALRYQYLLFQTKTGTVLPIANHFSDSTNLKKRIIMMNQKTTKSRKSYLRGMIFIPVMLAILVFSAFTQANHNLSNEIKQFQLVQEKDTLPSKIHPDKKKAELTIKQMNDLLKKLPLYVLKEGKEEKIITLKKFRKLDFNSIATIDVLKGPSASKKYGNKGKNGVVVIQIKEKKDE